MDPLFPVDIIHSNIYVVHFTTHTKFYKRVVILNATLKGEALPIGSTGVVGERPEKDALFGTDRSVLIAHAAKGHCEALDAAAQSCPHRAGIRRQAYRHRPGECSHEQA